MTMRKLLYSLLPVTLLFSSLVACASTKDSTYGISNSQPTLFAEGIITTTDATERSLTFSPDGSTVFFHRRDQNFPILYKSQYNSGTWSTPQIAEFALDRFHNESAFISPDGRTLIFASNRPG